MINWLIGGAIACLVLYIIVKHTARALKGEPSCCSGCSQKGICCCDGKTGETPHS